MRGLTRAAHEIRTHETIRSGTGTSPTTTCEGRHVNHETYLVQILLVSASDSTSGGGADEKATGAAAEAAATPCSAPAVTVGSSAAASRVAESPSVDDSVGGGPPGVAGGLEVPGALLFFLFPFAFPFGILHDC